MNEHNDHCGCLGIVGPVHGANDEMGTRLRLPSEPDQLFKAGVKLLDRFWERTQCVLGGDAVLQARWSHRHCSEVMCCTEEVRFLEVYERDSSLIDEALRQLEGEGSLKSYELHSRILVMEFLSLGEMSMIASNGFTPAPDTFEYEQVTGMRLEPTAEILAKKLTLRVVEGRWK